MSRLVFIVDDDKVYLKFMQNHFSQMEGYEVEVYPSPKEALIQLETKKPFMMILDRNLNDAEGDGIHYLKIIKKKKSSLPVLMITSDDTDDVRREAVRAGAKSVIIKSESFLVQLRTAIDEIIVSSNKGFFSKIFGS